MLALIILVLSTYRHLFQPILQHPMRLRVRDQRVPQFWIFTASGTFRTFGASGYMLRTWSVLIRNFYGWPLMGLESSGWLTITQPTYMMMMSLVRWASFC